MERLYSELNNDAHLDVAQGLVHELRCADRSRLFQVYLVRVGSPRQFGTPLPSEEGGYHLVGFCDGGSGGSGGSGAEFHYRDAAFEPEFEGGWASFGFKKDGLVDAGSVGCKHQRSSGVCNCLNQTAETNYRALVTSRTTRADPLRQQFPCD